MSYRIITLISMLIVFTQQSFSHEPKNLDDDAINCHWQGELIPVGESLWIEDPFLADLLIEEMSANGYDDKQIQHRLQHNDYTGFRIVCLAEVVYNHSPRKPGEVLTQVKGVMVVNRYSREAHQHYIALEKQHDTASRND